jgi:hypothetical protein
MEDELLLDWTERAHISIISVTSEITLQTLIRQGFFLRLLIQIAAPPSDRSLLRGVLKCA